jgi:hypothetical protein
MTVTTAGWVAIAIYFIPWPYMFIRGVRWGHEDEPEENDFIIGMIGICFCLAWPLIVFCILLGRLARKVR